MIISPAGTAHLEYRDFTLDFFWSDLDAFAMGVLPFWSNTNHEIRNKKMFVNAGYRFPVHERMALELNATYNLQENSLSSPAITRIGNNTSDLLAEVTLFANPTDNMNMVLGYLQEYRSNYHPDDDKYQSIPPYRHEPKSFYAQGDYKFEKFLKLIAGTQWNKSSYGSSDWISRYGLIITPADKWGVKLLRGEAFRAPFALETNLQDLVVLIGNKNLEPEKVVTYDAQLFYKDDKTYAAITYFDSEISNLIIRGDNPTPPPPRMFTNGGQQRFQGIEFETKRFLTSHWHILGSFLHQENDQTSDINISVVPNDMFKFGTSYTWDWGSAALFYSFFSKPPRLATEVVVNPEPDAMNLLSLNVRIDPSKWLDIPKGKSTLTFKIENLFDEDIYVPEFQRGGNPNSLPYGPGRTFYGGLTINF